MSMFKIPYLDYDEAEKNQLNENVELLLSNLDDKLLQTRIESFAKKHNLNPQFVLQKIIDDNIFALCFTKEPSKQTFHQTKAAEFIQTLPLISDFKTLPAGGNDALYVIKGNVLKGSELSSSTHGKSIDFYWSFKAKGKKIEFYATHKHTRTSGGSQDNQYNDVLDFLENASYCFTKDKFFFAITDGPYYLQRNRKLDNLTKIEYMNTIHSGKRCRATTVNELLYYVSVELKRWLTSNKLEKEPVFKEVEDIIQSYEAAMNLN